MEFKLKEVNGIWCSQDCIDTSPVCAHFNLYLKPKQMQGHIEHSLIVLFMGQGDGIWDTGKECMKNREETLKITRFQMTGQMKEVYTNPFFI